MTTSGALFKPMRLRILEELSEPDSAVGLARRLKTARQKVNYHLRELEREGLVELVEERKKGNCVERIVKATARSYVVGADAIAQLAGGDPAALTDRFSSAYLVAACARTISETAALRARADDAGQRLATFTAESEVRFADAGARAQFFSELSDALAKLIAKHHDAVAPGGRSYRLVLGAHPATPAKAKRTKKENA
jgi:DNA-binding transcriptional ArsR family regulator